MLGFTKYILEDGTVVEIANPKIGYDDIPPESKGIGTVQEKSAFRFDEAFSAVKKASESIMRHLRELHADEVEVEFGLTTTGHAGNFAIGTVGLEANYIVKLKWSSKEHHETTDN